ncbi:MAG: cysteine synthase A [Treponema sp.]|nr:cysteine synthase A [Treponema sp.]
MNRIIAKNITELIGNTPLLELTGLQKKYNLSARILAKLEYLNPAGSVKDRIAKAMIDCALNAKKITSTTTIIEPTSGNTGIGLASVCASYGLHLILTMPETMSIERRNLLKAYGAELVLTSGSLGMKGAVDKANELAQTIADSFIPSQFANKENPNIHYNTTAKEIWADTNGNVDAFIAGIGTGGTITGCGKFFREKNPNIKIYGIEPADSPLLSAGKAGPHKIQGIGANFVPEVLDTKTYDEIVLVQSDDAFTFAKEFAKTEGALVGISSGAALYLAVKLAKKAEFSGKTIIAILPDSGDRYMSTPLFGN